MEKHLDAQTASSLTVTSPSVSSSFFSMSRRRFLSRTALAVGALSSVDALVSACSSNGSAGASSPVTLQVMYDDGNEMSKVYGPLYHKLNPNVTIKVLQADPTRLSSMFAAGQPPDIVRVEASNMASYAARGLAANITPYLQSSSTVKVDNLQPIANLFRWDGKVQGRGDYYGLVKDWSISTQFWYNKKLFDQAKVPYPSTSAPLSYDEWLLLAKKLTVREGNKIKIYGLDMAWEFGFTYNQLVAMLAQDGASIFSSDMTKADFTTPEVKKALQWFVDWSQARVGPSPLDVGDNAFDLFGSGRLAMVNFGYWFGGGTISTYSQDIRANSALGLAPQWGKSRVLAETDPTGFFIPTNSKNKDAAWKFLEWFSGGQPAVDHSKTGFGIPPLKHLFSNLPQTTPLQQSSYQAVNTDIGSVGVLPSSPYASGSAISSAIQNALTSVIKGQSSMDDATQQLTNTVNLLLQQGQSQIG